MHRQWIVAIACGACVFAASEPLAAQSRGSRAPATQNAAGDSPSKQELDGARHRLENFEKKVARSGGQAMKLDVDGREAMDRIQKLKERYPSDPQVEELFQRARKVLLGSKGEIIEVPPDAAAFRQNEQKLKKIFADVADRDWAALKAKAEAEPNAILKPFPPASREDVSVKDMRGRYVILDGVLYPGNQFKDMGREFVYVGSPSRGYYFVELSNRAWAGAYAAVKRYRRLVNRDVPENAPWTVLGRVKGVDLLVPQAGEEKTDTPQWGWVVEPAAIYVPGCTVGVADEKAELGGQFAGEADAEKLKSAMYSVTTMPDAAPPEKVVEVFSVAIKEKNYPLYLECIDPNRRKTPIAVDLCQYHWDWHQLRFATMYVFIKIDPATVSVMEGFDEGNAFDSFYLTPEEREKLRKASGRLVEQAVVKTRAFDEKGKQYGSPKTFFLRRVDKGRWYIVNYPQPF